MTFREAKTVIRELGLREATDAKLVELLDAAREGRMPWYGAWNGDSVDECGCLEQRCHPGAEWNHDLSDAYLRIGEPISLPDDGDVSLPEDGEARRQRILVAMARAEQWRRNRPRGSERIG